MFKLFFIVFTLANLNLIVAQSSCVNSAPFCANQGAVSFPAGVHNGTAKYGPNYGCLAKRRNPAWYYFQVSQSGSIIIDIAGTKGYDVDFICYGPFVTPTGNCKHLKAENTVDCSFSSSSGETCTISNGIVGEYYILLLTNYSNKIQNINFNQISGTGATNCGLLSSSVKSQSISPDSSTALTVNSNFNNPTDIFTTEGAETQTISIRPTSTIVYSVSIVIDTSSINKNTEIKNNNLLINNTAKSRNTNTSCSSVVRYEHYFLYNQNQVDDTADWSILIDGIVSKTKECNPTVKILSSASQVTTRNFADNHELAKSRAEKLEANISQAVEAKGGDKSKIVFKQYTAVKGPLYSGDYQNTRKYLKYQYVKVIVR